jgi:hypothetical protein
LTLKVNPDTFPAPAIPIRSAAEWNEYWGTTEAGAMEGTVRYQGGDLFAKLLVAPEKLTADDFRLRPDSAGYRAGADGKDLGADVDLVGPGAAYERWKQTPEYQQWLNDTGQFKRSEPQAETKAFALLGANGVAEGKFDTLAEAVQQASTGDTIEIRGNGPFFISPIKIDNLSLVIRSGEGYRPVISLNPHEPGLTLIQTNSPLVLEGLEFRSSDNRRGHFVVSDPGSPLHIANCRVVSTHRHGLYCIEGRNSPVCTVRNSQFVTSASLAIVWSMPAGGKCSLENCVLFGTHAVQGECSRTDVSGASFHLRSNTIVRPQLPVTALNLFKSPKLLKSHAGVPPIRMEATANILDAPSVFALDQHPSQDMNALESDKAEEYLVDLLDWRDKGNLYTPGTSSLTWCLNYVPGEPHGPKTLTEWNQFWRQPDSGSLEGQVRYEGGNLAAAAQELTPHDFRLLPDSLGHHAGVDGKDLGADVNLVGPGAAYERWKKTPEYQQWLKDSLQVDAASGDARDFPRGSSVEILTSNEWEWTKAENLGPRINTDQADGGPTLSADGLTLIFHSKRTGGLGESDFWMSTRTSLETEWGDPIHLGAAINSPSNDADACLSADGLTLIFDSNRPDGNGSYDLWMATRSRVEEQWMPPVNLGAGINSAASDAGPALSADGLTLLFNSDQSGLSELWQCTRESHDRPWSSPKNLGKPVNSNAFQGWVTLSNDDQALIFKSNRAGGPIAGPLWIAARSARKEGWLVPVRLMPEESESAWSSCLSADATLLLFDSKRAGGHGDFDIWMMRRVRRK